MAVRPDPLSGGRIDPEVHLQFGEAEVREPEDPDRADDDFEESEEFRRSVEVMEPTARQREEHEQENHACYRPWCRVCVESRGLGTQHRKTMKGLAEASADGPRIFSDFFFMSTDERSAPMLVMKSSRSRRIAAVALPSKGISEFGVKAFSAFIANTGLRRFTNFSDGEPAMIALKGAAARACQGVESINKEVPVGDHRANGDAEVSVREIKRQMRALRLSLESKLGVRLSDRDPLLFWMPSFAGDAIACHRRGKDGKTAYERETGRKWHRSGLEYGEALMIRVAVEEAGKPKRDWRTKMVKARFVGHHARTGSILGLTPNGLVLGGGSARLAKSERWDPAGIEELKGLPWDTKVREVNVPAVGAGERQPQRLAAPVRGEDPGSRAFCAAHRHREVRLHGWMSRMRWHQSRQAGFDDA